MLPSAAIWGSWYYNVVICCYTAEHSRAQQSTAEHELFASFWFYLLMLAAVCFSLLLFAAFCCSFPLFVAICLSLLLFAAGCSQKRPRKVPRWPSGDPKWLQNVPKIDQNWLLGLPGDPPGQLNPNFQSQGPIWGHFWVPYGVPKSTKNQPLAQKVVPGTTFSSTFVAHSDFYVF